MAQIALEERCALSVHRPEFAMVQKEILASFPCRIRRRARILTGALIGQRCLTRARARHVAGSMPLVARCSSESGSSLANMLRP
jgi:hypothetical protein